MGKIINLARAMGEAIQKDEHYLEMMKAQEISDNDAELQTLIGEFNLKRISLNHEMAKDDKDDEKIKAVDKELREVYTKLMGNPNMLAYQTAKSDFDKIINDAVVIIQQSSAGADPKTVDPAACGGSCSSCAGC